MLIAAARWHNRAACRNRDHFRASTLRIRIVWIPGIDETGTAGAQQSFDSEAATSQIVSGLVLHLADSGTNVHAITSRQLYDGPQARDGHRKDAGRRLRHSCKHTALYR